MSVNIYDAANQLERDLRKTDQYKKLEGAFETLQKDDEAKALFDQFRLTQQTLQQKQMSGQEIGEDEAKQAQELSQKVGNNDVLSELIQAEQDLFRKWCAGHQQSFLLTFSYLYLWSGQSYLQLQSGLRQLISNQQMEAIIEALWEEGAVLTKAAQKLYLHRNTLQYRLDKWQEMTGLQLKDLNDLAICHQAILGMSI